MICLDMDGVLADFDKAVLSRGVCSRNDYIHKPKKHWSAEDKALDLKIVECMNEPGWFYNLEMMPGAIDLVRASVDSGESVVILTARPKETNSAERVEAEKKAWIKKYIDPHFVGSRPNGLHVYCVVRSQKQDFAVTTDRDGNETLNILIDDLPANVEEWQKAGGIGILYKNATQAVRDLNKIV